DPSQRLPSVQAVIGMLRGVLRELADETARPSKRRMQTNADDDKEKAISGVMARQPVADVTEDQIRKAEFAVYEWGYSVERNLGKVRGHPVYLANPRQELITSGQFPDANTFPKLVTVIDLTKVTDPRAFVENWQRYFWPILKRVRQGLM